MTVRSFSGGAGCGKTFALINALEESVSNANWTNDKQVLALTFMHGSRQRLDERLRLSPTICGRFTCVTLDSFAAHVVDRWRSLRERLGLPNIAPEDFEAVCEVAHQLLIKPEVIAWVVRKYPLLIVDEAQDLTPHRLRVIQALAVHMEVIVAADEFQCLDEELRPNPACQWLEQIGNVETLTTPRRTTNTHLINGALAIRSGLPPISQDELAIRIVGNAQRTAEFVSNALGWWGRTRNAAIISPFLGNFARAVIERVQTTRSARGQGPYSIKIEQPSRNEQQVLIASLNLADDSTLSEAKEAVQALENRGVRELVSSWLDLLRRTTGRTHVTRQDIENAIADALNQLRRFRVSRQHGFRAMTVHGAKNREFDLVVVLWPAGVPGDPEHQRRLLYNAVTRARQRCIVLAQTSPLLRSPPFT